VKVVSDLPAAPRGKGRWVIDWTSALALVDATFTRDAESWVNVGDGVSPSLATHLRKGRHTMVDPEVYEVEWRNTGHSASGARVGSLYLRRRA
jgi:hypothetical protein